jgi:hypothetical protein
VPTELAGHYYTKLASVTTQVGQTISRDRSAEGMINRLKAEAVQMGAAILVRRSGETFDGQFFRKQALIPVVKSLTPTKES